MLIERKRLCFDVTLRLRLSERTLRLRTHWPRRAEYIICSGSGFWLKRKVLGWRTAFRRCPGWSQCFSDERWRRIGRRREAILQSKRRQRSMFAQEEPIGDTFWASQYFLTFTAFHFPFLKTLLLVIVLRCSIMCSRKTVHQQPHVFMSTVL